MNDNFERSFTNEIKNPNAPNSSPPLTPPPHSPGPSKIRTDLNIYCIKEIHFFLNNKNKFDLVLEKSINPSLIINVAKETDKKKLLSQKDTLCLDNLILTSDFVYRNIG